MEIFGYFSRPKQALGTALQKRDSARDFSPCKCLLNPLFVSHASAERALKGCA
jgi:hypothetical protein